jgi:L-methionine (R)-S-oxide reductase
MAHEINSVNDVSKEENYEQLLPQIRALVAGEKDLVANLSNIVAALKTSFHWLWVGFYLVKENELVLGPFQGHVACTRIAHGKGVCGTSWKQKKTLVVPDVDKFEGHIACSTDSRSEIVVPVLKRGEVIAVLDVDSESPDHFDSVDQKYLEELSGLVSGLF